MQKTAIDDVEPVPHLMGVNAERRPVSRSIDEMGFAMVVFELGPGESFSGAPHKHLDQEELFYILEGTATWETKAEPGADPETVEVGPNEVIHFPADDVYQTGGNRSEETVRGITIGSPGARHDWGKVLGLADCPECGCETAHTYTPDEEVEDVRMPAIEEMTVECVECGNQL